MQYIEILIRLGSWLALGAWIMAQWMEIRDSQRREKGYLDIIKQQSVIIKEQSAAMKRIEEVTDKLYQAVVT